MRKHEGAPQMPAEQKMEFPAHADDMSTALKLLREARSVGYETRIVKKPDGAFEIDVARVVDWPERVEDEKRIPISKEVFEQMHRDGLLHRFIYDTETREELSWWISQKIDNTAEK